MSSSKICQPVDAYRTLFAVGIGGGSAQKDLPERSDDRLRLLGWQPRHTTGIIAATPPNTPQMFSSIDGETAAGITRLSPH
jgi:hypothetical protein